MIKRLTLLAGTGAILMFSGISSNAQTTCKWSVTSSVDQPTCAKTCNGSVSISIQNASGFIFTYQWSNGATTANNFNLCEGQYSLTITDDKGCSQTLNFNIVEPAPVIASCTVVSNESSAGASDGELSASASGGNSPYTFEWQTNPPVNGATLSGLSAGTYFVIASDANGCQASTFCVITTEKIDSCYGFRTQTQGGWGQCHQNGNNPGTYLFANFAGAFPNGLTIGCTNTLHLSSAQAVCEFLPSGSKPRALPSGQMSDPAWTYKNVLAGQLVTLMLNVGFDAYDEGFSVGDADLGNQVIASGQFSGWTVNDLVAEANDAIGGCGSSYGYSKLNNIISAINENYDDGKRDKGVLDCPDKKKKSIGNGIEAPDVEVLRANIYPNPMNSEAKIDITTNVSGELVVDIFNYSGQKVLHLFDGSVDSNENKSFTIDASNLPAGIYITKISLNGEIKNMKLFIQK